jgi:subtilisin family serine protease
MKKTISFYLLVLLQVITYAQNNEFPLPQLSASTMQYLWDMQQKGTNKPEALPYYVYNQDNAQNTYLRALIKVQPGFTESQLLPYGIKIGTKAGNIWTAQVPLNKVVDFTKIRGIKNIELDQPSYPDLDTARKVTRVDSVHSGYGLPQAYTGNNVVVGIIDAGFDYTHPTFFDTSLTNYRIKRVWEEKNNTGTAPAPFGYGTELSDSTSIFNKQNDITTGTHGTHVTGIAAGSGSGSLFNKRFRGVAFNSDIVMVGIYPTAAYWLNTGMADMLDGINYVFNYASSFGKPAVANLSWGCPIGPHDGSSLFSQACDNLTGAGKIFVLSGGNNGSNNIHLKKSFTTTDTELKTVCTFSSYLTEKRNLVDIWGDSSKTFCVKFALYNGVAKIDSTISVCLDNSTHQFNLIGSNNDTCFVTITAIAAEFNNKPHALINLYSKVTDKLSITVTANDGEINMWQGFVKNTSGYYGAFVTGGLPLHTAGNSNSTISDMVTTRSAIGVAAFNSKPSFVNISGQSLAYSGYTKGAIASFSSKGPTADGRTKPNIAGPGMALASSISSFDTTYNVGGSNYNSVISNFVSSINNQTYSFAMAAGTSMSGPTVSGIVGLMLEAKPTLTPQNIMTVLYLTAIKDNYTGVINMATGSNVWGWGKVNAYQAVLGVLNSLGIEHIQTNANCIMFPNPSNGNYQLAFVASTSEKISISVLNSEGKKVKEISYNVTPGDNLITIDLASFTSGIYFTIVNTKDGNSTIKIIKQ